MPRRQGLLVDEFLALPKAQMGKSVTLALIEERDDR